MTGETLNARWPGENAGAMPPVGVTAKKPRAGAASSERSQAACLPCGTPEAGARLSICSGRRCDRRVTGPGRGAALLCVRAAAGAGLPRPSPCARVQSPPRARAVTEARLTPRGSSRRACVSASPWRPAPHAGAVPAPGGAREQCPARRARPPPGTRGDGAPRPRAASRVRVRRGASCPRGALEGGSGGTSGEGAVFTAVAPAPGPLRGRTVRLVARTRAA